MELERVRGFYRRAILCDGRLLPLFVVRRFSGLRAAEKHAVRGGRCWRRRHGRWSCSAAHTCLASDAPRAGVCCLRELASRLPPEARDVTLVAPGDNAKARQPGPTLPVSRSHPFPCLARAAQCVENVARVTRKVEIFNGACSERRSCVAAPLEGLSCHSCVCPVVETPLALLLQPGIRLVRGVVGGVDEARKARAVETT